MGEQSLIAIVCLRRTTDLRDIKPKIKCFNKSFTKDSYYEAGVLNEACRLGKITLYDRVEIGDEAERAWMLGMLN